MIWRFHFSRKSLIWMLALAFVAGAGLQITRQTLKTANVLPVGIVTGTPEAIELRRRADSIMQVRRELAEAPLDINRASAAELERLDGIGPVLSRRIVDYRERHGPFRSVDELDDVQGIGPKKLAAVRDRCVVGGQ